MNDDGSNKKRKLVSAGAFGAVVIAAFIFAFVTRKSTPPAIDASSVTVTPSIPVATQTPVVPAPSTGMMPPTAMPTKMPAHMTEYKDGTYSAIGSYDSPGGLDRLGVSVTIANDVVTDSSLTLMPGDRTSSRYQQAFAGGYKAQVIGKAVDSIHLDTVSGSSLTPIGFDQALAAIKAKAKS